MEIGTRLSARRPAKLLVEEAHRQQRAGHARGLLGPPLAAVVGVQDDAPVADRPALAGIDETHVVEPGVVWRRVARRAGNGQSGNGKCQAEEHAILWGRLPTCRFNVVG